MKHWGSQFQMGYKSRRKREFSRQRGTTGSRNKARKYVKNKDRISSLPAEVTQLILERLPLLIAARTSVLSKTWEQNWLSLSTLDFNADFWEGQMKNGILDGQKFCSIITNILLSHNGPIKRFLLHIPENIEFLTGCLNLSPWLSFLSKNEVEIIEIINRAPNIPISVTSNIFHCTFLMKLRLDSVTLAPPPPDFKGFPIIEYLSFVKVSFRGDSFESLISMCPLLKILILNCCDGVNDIVLNAPCLDSFLIRGAFETLSLEDIKNVYVASLSLEKETEDEYLKAKLADPLRILASSSRLKHLLLEGHSTKALNAGGIRSHRLTFNQISRLTLTRLDLSDFDIFRSTWVTICSCPNIHYLGITVSYDNADKHDEDYDYEKYDYDDKKMKLKHLRTVKIDGLRRTFGELRLLHHLLAVSSVLEELMYRYDAYGIDAETEVLMLRELLEFPRASSKAQLLLRDELAW